MEAFITPIILNYVDKYVILRPQDAQLSIWEGDVAFQNLDLRLDVLQEELQLPFEFLSGHIHELIIHIPWTKITSEPISVTINTIEFVLKLRDLNATASTKPEKTKPVQYVEETPKGYINALVDKIVNNISITCNNIILKYVEEDIVVSMNVQLLSLSSADNNWNPAFIDISPSKVVLRKLIQVSDLTICLDKRNSLGQIDVCQEPILYRCSLETRILRKYNSATVQLSSDTNIEIYTKSLELNISSQQFPMAMRLIMLMTALKSGELKSKSSTSTQTDSGDVSERLTTSSMISWAWSKVPSFFPHDSELEDGEPHDGHVLSTGVYIGSFKVTLKSLELFSDTIVQTSRKIRYNPIFRLTLNGIFAETIIAGPEWINTKAGISQATVEPLGTYVPNNKYNNAFLTTDSSHSEMYLAGSLFDPNLFKSSKHKKFLLDLESHMFQVNKVYLLNRAPAFVIDLVHYVNIPDGTRLASELESDLEYSNLSETTHIRVFISSVAVKYNSAAIRVTNTVQELISSYDYPPYVEERTDSSSFKLPPPSMDDYDALMTDIPRKTIEITSSNFRIEMHPLVESISHSAKSNLHIKSVYKKQIPFINLCINHMKVTNVSPIYQNRLVHTTCQLPVKPKELLDACYNSFDISISDLVLSIVDSLIEIPLLRIPNIEASVGSILKASYWSNDTELVRGLVDIECIVLSFTRPQEILFFRVLNTLMSHNHKAVGEVTNSSARKDIYNQIFNSIEIQFSKILLKCSKFKHGIGTKGYLDAIEGFILDVAKHENKESLVEEIKKKFLLFSAPKIQLPDEHFLEFVFQIPMESTHQSYPHIMWVMVKESALILDPVLETIFKYDDVFPQENDEKCFNADDSSYQDAETKSSRISVISERHSKKILYPEETIHISSDKEEQIQPCSSNHKVKSTKESCVVDILLRLNHLVLCIEINQCEIIFPTKSINQIVEHKFNYLENVIRKDFTSIKLPNVRCKSSTSLEYNNIFSVFPISVPESVLNDGFPWTISILKLSGLTCVKGNTNQFLMPINTNITIALDAKTQSTSSNYALNWHLDTGPITLNISSDQVMFLKKSLGLLLSLPKLVTYTKIPEKSIINQQSKIMKTIDDDSTIKDFLAMKSNSEISSEPVVRHSGDTEENLFPIWLQWTLTKITINLLCSSNFSKSKVAIELEDFITSIDKQHIYFKLKSKIGVFRAHYFHLNEKQEWIANDALKLTVRPQTTEGNTSDTFLDITVTVAETGSVLKKWGAKKNLNLNQTLTEVVVNLQAIDFQFNIQQIDDLMPLINALGADFDKNPSIIYNKSDCLPPKSESIISVSDLPLLYFESKGIVLYIPLENHQHPCDVLIFKVGSIKISPNVENPLTRLPLRPDVYTKAAQLRILNTPGSSVEDRQYELTISDISTATSNWNEVLAYMKENSESFHNTNPAFEWNNQSKRPSVKFNEIFKKFVLSITYAPCIVYKKTLICGQSIELNCVTDLIVNLSTDQVLLLHYMLTVFANLKCMSVGLTNGDIEMKNNIIKLGASTFDFESKSKKPIDNHTKSHCDLRINTSTKFASLVRLNKLSKAENAAAYNASNMIASEKIRTDSGIASLDKTNTIDTINAHLSISDTRHIPYEISFVAGIFSLKLYKSSGTDKNQSERSKNLSLLAFTFTQPSMLISQKLLDYTVKYSLFNLMITFGEAEDKNEVTTPEFDDIIFETMQGNLNTAGIPPPLLCITYKNTILKKTEIDCLISRPTKLFFSHKTFEKVLNIRILLNEVFIADRKCTKKPNYKPLVRGSTIQLIRNSLLNSDRFSISLEQLKVVCRQSNQYDVKMSLGKIEANLDICNRPERLDFLISIDSMFLSTERLIMIHPITLKGYCTLLQETWCRFPIIISKIETNVVHIDIGPQHILSLMQIEKIMMKSYNEFLEKCDQLSSQTVLKAVPEIMENLEKIAIPEASKKQRPKSTVEFYQDDLRAGAFQFIEENDDSDLTLPLPYQIKIITKNNGALCWRYPQPRSISKLQLYPIPLATSTPINVKCSLEYYNDALSKFVPYFQFSLSESETQVLDLPKVKNTAYIWRVVILQKLIAVDGRHFDESTSSEEDEELETLGINKIKIEDVLGNPNPKHKSILHPKALVACMRIDSSFNPDYVPKFQIVLNAAYVQINLQNHFKAQKKGFPPPIQQFKLARDFLESQTISTLVLSNLNFYGLLVDWEKYAASLDMKISCTLLDYSYLNMLHFLEQTNVKGLLDVREVMETNIVIDAIRINVGPAMMHTILVSEQIWTQILQKNTLYSSIITRFVICNCTNLSFQFGQTETSELLLLKPNECSFYSFRSDHLKQRITLFFDDKYWNGSCSADIAVEGVQYLKVNNFVIIVKVEKLSSTQLCVFVKGQVEFLSMSKEMFRLQHRTSNIEHQLDLPQHGQGSFIGQCNQETEHFIRVKFGDEKRKGWSGEIPLVNKTIPWLVKVPSSTNHLYITFWVRVVVENIATLTTNNFKPKRILVIIWPMFVVRSLLTSDMIAEEANTNSIYDLKGRGATVELQIAGTNETEHELILRHPIISMQDSEKSKALLSYKAVDWNKFFWADEKYSSIEICVKELKKPISINWPCSKNEELQIMRASSPKEATFPIYRFLPSREFSCSLMLEIVPWCLFINSSGKSMRISNLDNEKNVIVDCNNITTLFAVENALAIEIGCGTHWIQSCPIYINENGFKKSTSKNKLLLCEEGTITFQIAHTSVISQYSLTSTSENNIRIFTLSSKFSVANCSDYVLDAIPFAFDGNEKIYRKKLDELSSGFSFKIPKKISLNKMKGVSIDQFYDICGKNSQKSLYNNSSLRYYICLRLSNNSDISVPVLISKPFNRKCFSIQNYSESIALAASVIEKGGIYFLNIFNDTCPAVQLRNNTDLTFFISETKTIDSSKPVKITPEINEKGFEWYQMMRSQSNLYYTPPEMYITFPDIENINSNLSLALCLQNDSLRPTYRQNIRWSKPLQLRGNSEKLLNIPLHGDVKVIVCDDYKTIKISIFYITQHIEFSVKDLRTRLQDPHKPENSINLWDQRSEDTVQSKSKSIEMDLTNTNYNICSVTDNQSGVQKVNVFVKEITLNILVDSKMQSYLKTEIFAIYIDDFVFQFDSEKRSTEIIISNLQIDNQLYSTGNYDFPVILCSQELYKCNNPITSPSSLYQDISKYKSNPLIQLLVTYYKDRFDMESIHCKINPIRSYIEDTYLNDLLDHLFDCGPSNVAYVYEDPQIRLEDILGYIIIPDDVIKQAVYLSQPLQLRSIKIEPISVMLSVHTCVRLYIALDHSPLDFSTYERRNILTLPLRFGHTIGMHYLSGALFGAGWVVGSLEILGSPSGLARSLSTGLRDFVSMPVQGLLQGPWGFLTGVTQGSASLLRNITAGAVNSVSKLAASVARNLDRLTLDEEHFQRTEVLRRSRPQGFTEGFAQGLTGLGISLLGAVGGLARHPLEAKSSVGVVTGVAKGIFGALAKPLSGAAELVALSGQGMLHTVGFNTLPRQKSPTKTSNPAAYPAVCKLAWKMLPNILLAEQVLFYHEATMITDDQLQRVIICLTPSLLLILGINKDDVLEVIPVERIEMVIDANDRTLFDIKVLNSDEYSEEAEPCFINTRILNFLRDSSDHIPSTTHSIQELVAPNTSKNYKLHWSFYISPQLGLHLSKYITLVKCNLDDLNCTITKHYQ